MTRSRAVLITGCSSGVGHAAAQRFLRAGHPVYATARRPDTLAELAERGAVTLPLDLTDDASMTAAVERVERDHGAVGILVNNAAYGLQGAIEAVRLDRARRQFETNLFGTIRMCQLAAPAMRAQGGGRIVNVSAMGAHFTLPGTGMLHASKHALRAVSNALRLELRPFGITVTMVEPGPISTPFPEKANATLPPAAGDGPGNDGTSAKSDGPGSGTSGTGAGGAGGSGPYDRFHIALAARMEAAYKPGAASMVLTADAVARAIERAAGSARPRARYPVGVMCRGVIALSRLLPDAALDAIIRWQFPLPEPVAATEDRRTTAPSNR
jgi:NAD(P)-dependent dehydrogenase (short-subunit alcohol dehydrogenase family)